MRTAFQDEILEATEYLLSIHGPDDTKRWKAEIMRLFWGWFGSTDSIGLSVEQHDDVIITVRELTRFFDRLEAAYEAGNEADHE